MRYHFGGYTLDIKKFELRSGSTPIPLQPQVFDLLAYLVQHHDRLVAKSEIMDHLWPEAFVTEAALTTCLMEARKALGDTGREQRFIRNVHGRGYQFVAPVQVGVESDTPTPARVSPSAVTPERLATISPTFVGRDHELAALTSNLAAAQTGRRQAVLVAGEAGLGKTSLIRAFEASAGLSEAAWLGHGQSLEHRDSGEAYKPLLDAFAHLCRGANGDEVIEVLLRTAPTWLLQLPGLLDDQQLQRLHERTIGTTRERMLREFVEAVETLSQLKPVVLVLEDLHWSDASTLDALAWIAYRDESAPVLLIGTYRPSGTQPDHTLLDRLVQELRTQGRCEIIDLPSLSDTEMERYLAARFPGAPFIAELAGWLTRRTDGHPLFVTAVLNDWIQRGLLAVDEGVWRFNVPIESLAGGIPDSVRQIIEGQLDRLSPSDRQIVEVAGVAGPEFSSAVIAAGLEVDEEEAEERCTNLAQPGRLFTLGGSANWPDGTVAGKFAFVHTLYQEAVYQRVPPGRRSRLHRAIGERLERAYGRHAPEHAVELASHFIEGRDDARAVRYLHLAAEEAMAIGGNREAVQHFSNALEILKRSDSVADRQERESVLQARLGMARLVTDGFGSREAEASFQTALELAGERRNSAHVANIAFGLAALLEYQGRFSEATTLLDHLPAETIDGSAPLQICYHALQSCSAFHRGQFSESVEQADRGVDLYQRSGTPIDGHYAFLGEDPVFGCSEWASLALWFLGFPDQAVQRVEELIALTSAPGRRFGLSAAFSHAARLYQLLGEPARARELAAQTADLARQQGFAYHIAVGVIVEGWATGRLGDPARGLTLIEAGLSLHSGTGASMDRPYFLALRADILDASGQRDRALETLQAALETTGRPERFFYEAEILRQIGEIAADRDEAEQYFQRAIDVARGQNSRSLQLRAATSMARLLQARGESARAADILEPILTWFQEGHRTKDVRQATEVLASTGRLDQA